MYHFSKMKKKTFLVFTVNKEGERTGRDGMRNSLAFWCLCGNFLAMP